jgi:NADH dehydrogenase
MTDSKLCIVTGAFGYSGRHITKRLLSEGKRVRTLTGHPDRPNPFGDQIEVARFDFQNPDELAKSMEGADVLFNTYWIRFDHGNMTFDKAVENSKTLVRAAEVAGVRRIVHVSITNPSATSRLPYYKGKSEVEKAIISSKLSYAILRPNVLFGDEGILINNIAWLLRRFPIFAVPGKGDYKIQAMYVDDLAELAVSLAERNGSVILDAVGPEIYSFNELVKLVAKKLGRPARLVHVSPSLALFLSGMIGRIVGDVILTPDEVRGLDDNLLVSSQEPTGHTLLSKWLEENAEWLGTRYMSEIKKHF